MVSQESQAPIVRRSTPQFDPEVQPSREAGFGLPIIEEDELTTLFHRAFLPEHQWQQDQLVTEWNTQKDIVRYSYIQAGVLIPIVYQNDQVQVVLTKRASTLRSHRGQISFPGGRFDLRDKDLEDAALRETEEEIGVSRSDIDVLGKMPVFYTGTGYAMNPYLGILAGMPQFKIDTREVEELFLVPLNYFMNPNNYRLYTVADDSLSFAYYGMRWANHFIWGATASILRNLYQRIQQAR